MLHALGNRTSSRIHDHGLVLSATVDAQGEFETMLAAFLYKCADVLVGKQSAF